MQSKYHSYLLIIFVIFLTAGASALLLFFNMDIEKNMQLGIGLMAGAIFLTLSSFLSLFIYFFKKILYRGEVSGTTIISSFRQGILLSIGIVGTIAMMHFQVLIPKTFGLYWLVLLFIELMFQSMSDD